MKRIALRWDRLLRTAPLWLSSAYGAAIISFGCALAWAVLFLSWRALLAVIPGTIIGWIVGLLAAKAMGYPLGEPLLPSNDGEAATPDTST